MSNELKSVSRQKTEQLLDRCTTFAESVVSVLRSIKVNPVNRRIIEQCAASAGSIGANYCEATEAESKRDFVHKIGIASKEIKETRHWLRILATTNPEELANWRRLWKEATELLLIFSSILWTSKKKMANEK